MANFDVVTRHDHRDVAGRVLDCTPETLIQTSGKVLRWRNVAPRLRGVARFGDPYQPTVDNAPAYAAGAAAFVRSDAQFLQVPLVGTIAASQQWTFVIAMTSLGFADDQVLLASQNGSLIMYRRKSGVLAYTHSGGTVSGAVGIIEGAAMLAFDGAGAADYLVDGADKISAGAMTDVSFPADTDDALLIGKSAGGGDELDAALTHVLAWNRVLSPLERDFVWYTIAPGSETHTRAPASRVVWGDDRINPKQGHPPRFTRAQSQLGGARVQLACEVGGAVLPDADLGGDLFSISKVETAGEVHVYQDAGWSSVFDLQVGAAGHYSMLINRQNGGGRIVRFDVA